ncbi:MAG: Asp-tRNA(Asn)/Glu-tRNA(Gln) amidotransferase subunit GatC [Saprospiraceae bacterium]|nr:Asp-tRNA(Asn)/Glu-tRNA(Gln) amidotransferase subunit GatC [Saprospiraceae bacterium]MCB0543481.1 Asp-tRNA(Asn)/Glu-tRNA(Gln) amidotransferase subunit GatC [Saprospiraceae bacterium]MCB0573453.1 Asp-tRNA(Asn)/Glu-tRNA(Gln) amidotransferase subunit GatC [Saprospiraceae bacterium]MCB9354455.1 Asp-tRNA(Asn)/Glu-tRNA(Gln) amidotransferase subunit GatC [Lewinellaceae bacterium]
MQPDKNLISKLEKLARLQLSEPEREKLNADLQRMIDMVDKLREMDTEGIEPLIYLSSGEQALRPDKVGQQLTQKEALQNAPRQDGQFFRVPKVIE